MPPAFGQLLLTASLALIWTGNAPAGPTGCSGDPLPRGALARLGTVRFRAETALDGLVLSPDRRWIAGPATAFSLYLWERSTGKLVRRLKVGVPGAGFAFSPDGKRLAARELGGAWDIWGVWDPASGRQTARIPLGRWGKMRPRHVAFTSDGKHLVFCLLPAVPGSGRQVGVIYRVDAAGAAARRSVEYTAANGGEEHHGSVLSPDTRRVAVLVYDRQTRRQEVRVIEAASGKVLARAKEPEKHGWRSVDFTPDGRTLVATGYDHLMLLDAFTGKRVGKLNTGPGAAPSVIGFGPGGKTVVTYRKDPTGEVRVWNLATREEVKRFQSVPYCVAASDGRMVALGQGTAVRQWDLRSGKELPDGGPGHRGPVTAVAFSPDGRTLATGQGSDWWIAPDERVGLWDGATGKLRRFLHTRVDASAVSPVLAFAPGGRRLAVGWYLAYRGPGAWEVATGKEVVSGAGWGGGCVRLTGMALTPDGRAYLWAGNGRAHENDPPLRLRIERRDAATGRLLNLAVDREKTADWAAFSPDGGLAACGGGGHGGSKLIEEAKELRLLDARTARQLWARPEANPGWIGPVAFTPDGRFILIGSCDGWLSLYEVATASPAWRVALFDRQIAAVAFSPDGRLLATADWSLKKEYHSRTQTEAEWSRVARRDRFTPGPRTAAEFAIRFWELPAGREVGRIEDTGSRVCSLAFSPDGRRLASGLSNGTALVWDVGAFVRPTRAGPTRLPAGRLDECWKDLISYNGRRAYQALAALHEAPEEAVRFLAPRLPPPPPFDPKHLDRLLRALDSDRFKDREAATKELRSLPAEAQGDLRRALRRATSAEVRMRLRDILSKWPAPPYPKELRGRRAVALLEWVGSADARRALGRLARGAPEARLTREAKAALDRLDRRAAALGAGLRPRRRAASLPP